MPFPGCLWDLHPKKSKNSSLFLEILLFLFSHFSCLLVCLFICLFWLLLWFAETAVHRISVVSTHLSFGNENINKNKVVCGKNQVKSIEKEPFLFRFLVLKNKASVKCSKEWKLVWFNWVDANYRKTQAKKLRTLFFIWSRHTYLALKTSNLCFKLLHFFLELFLS